MENQEINGEFKAFFAEVASWFGLTIAKELKGKHKTLTGKEIDNIMYVFELPVHYYEGDATRWISLSDSYELQYFFYDRISRFFMGVGEGGRIVRLNDETDKWELPLIFPEDMIPFYLPVVKDIIKEEVNVKKMVNFVIGMSNKSFCSNENYENMQKHYAYKRNVHRPSDMSFEDFVIQWGYV